MTEDEPTRLTAEQWKAIATRERHRALALEKELHITRALLDGWVADLRANFSDPDHLLNTGIFASNTEALYRHATRAN